MTRVTDAGELADDLAKKCRSRDQCLIGVEHEKFVFRTADRRRLPYAGPVSIQALLGELQAFDWEPQHEHDQLIGLRRNDAAITLEPAGQLELSGRPWPDLHGVCREMVTHRRELADVCASMDLGTLATGFAPEWRLDEASWMPHSRYHIMRDYMPRVGVHGRDMMTGTCSFQMNFDVCSEQDMRDKYRVAMALQPLVMIALANSPFAGGRNSRLTSYRNYVWLHTDSARCGTLPTVFSPDFGFHSYVERMLDVPMYSVRRQGIHRDLAGRSFREMMTGSLPGLPGEKPGLDDWYDHLNTVMFDVRLKDHLELRGNDSLSLEHSMALAAFWTGILYDEQSLAEAVAFVEDCEVACLNQLRHQLPQLGLTDNDLVLTEGIYREASLPDALAYAAGLARDGLRRRAKPGGMEPDETVYLRPLEGIISNHLSPAEQWQQRFLHEGTAALEALYHEAGF